MSFMRGSRERGSEEVRRIFPILHFIRDSKGEHPLRLEILLESVERLILHEETIPENLEELRESFRRSSYFWHPIIVDRESRVVLDGMHRVASLREMGYRYIPVLTIDAMDPHVRLERWIRCYAPGEGVNILRVIEEEGFTYEVELRGEGEELIKRASLKDPPRGQFRVIDTSGGAMYRLEVPSDDPVEVYARIRELEMALERVAGETRYSTESSLLEGFKMQGLTTFVVPPRLSKEEVFEVARGGRLFCPKATRFVLPVRVMFVNTPIYLLEEGEMDCEERNRIHYLVLRQRRLFKIEGNVDIDRRYEEPYLYLFE